jgi:hypothetical protein
MKFEKLVHLPSLTKDLDKKEDYDLYFASVNDEISSLEKKINTEKETFLNNFPDKIKKELSLNFFEDGLILELRKKLNINFIIIEIFFTGELKYNFSFNDKNVDLFLENLHTIKDVIENKDAPKNLKLKEFKEHSNYMSQLNKYIEPQKNVFSLLLNKNYLENIKKVLIPLDYENRITNIEE